MRSTSWKRMTSLACAEYQEYRCSRAQRCVSRCSGLARHAFTDSSFSKSSSETSSPSGVSKLSIEMKPGCCCTNSCMRLLRRAYSSRSPSGRLRDRKTTRIMAQSSHSARCQASERAAGRMVAAHPVDAATGWCRGRTDENVRVGRGVRIDTSHRPGEELAEVGDAAGDRPTDVVGVVLLQVHGVHHMG